jgi:hypothetical protein
MGECEPSFDAFWASLARQILPRVQVAIIEALWKSDRPLTPTELAEIVEGATITVVNLHLRHLHKISAVAYANEPKRLDIFDVPFRLVRNSNR